MLGGGLFCEGEGFEVVGAVGGAVEVDFGFGGVGCFAVGEIGVFCVVEHQVFHAEHIGLLAGIEGGAVVLVVGAELLTVFVEAESLAEQPVAAAHIFLVAWIVGLVAQAHHTLSVGHEHFKSELRSLFRTQVEASHLHVVDHDFLAVGDFLQNDAVAYGTLNFSGNEQLANGDEGMAHLAIAVNHQLTGVLALMDERRNFAYEPHHAKDMVGVDMGHKYVANFLVWDMSLVKLTENAVAAASVHKHSPRLRAEIEAGVVAACAHCIASAEKSDRVHIIYL